MDESTSFAKSRINNGITPLLSRRRLGAEIAFMQFFVPTDRAE